MDNGFGSFQALQRSFDSAHQFDFSDRVNSDLSIPSFSALALCGEVGELANQIKKAQRASWLGENADEYIDRAIGELGGVLAYLLKLSNSLDTDLAELYLTTLSNNWLRFANYVKPVQGRGRTLSIVGPSGSGKSTAVRALATDHTSIYIEDVTKNPYLTGLYETAAVFDAFQSQRWFLEQIDQFVRARSPGETLILDQDPAATVRVYSAALRRDGRLKTAEYSSLLRQLISVEERIAAERGSRVMIFIDAEATTLQKRMHQRGDKQVPDLAWLEQIRNGFLELHATCRGSALIKTEGKSVEEVVLEIAGIFAR